MSIQRTQSSQASENAKSREADDRLRSGRRESPSAEMVDRFRALMQARGGDQTLEGRMIDARLAEQSAEQAMMERDLPSQAVDAYVLPLSMDDKRLESDTLAPAEASALWQAQTMLRDAPMAQAAPPPQMNPNAFVELIERHVRQLAVSASAVSSSDGQVLLRMSESTLPGTDLLLSRTPEGWLLRADVHSRSSFDAIREAAPELSKRFAERNLGTLSIDPRFHG